MRVLSFYFKKLSIILILLIFFGCKKEKKLVNIQLFDQSPKIIETYIEGKWRVHFMTGGISGGDFRSNRESLYEYYAFMPEHRLNYTIQNNVMSDTSYSWVTYQGGTWDYVHNIINSRYGSFEVEKIYKDTLVLARPFIGNPDFDRLLLTKED